MLYFWSVVIAFLVYFLLQRYFVTEEQRTAYYFGFFFEGCIGIFIIVLTAIMVGLGFIYGTKEEIFDLIKFYNRHYRLDVFLYAAIIVIIMELIRKLKNR